MTRIVPIKWATHRWSSRPPLSRYASAAHPLAARSASNWSEARRDRRAGLRRSCWPGALHGPRRSPLFRRLAADDVLAPVHLPQGLGQIRVGELLFICKAVIHLIEQITGLSCQPQLADELAHLQHGRGVQQQPRLAASDPEDPALGPCPHRRLRQPQQDCGDGWAQARCRCQPALRHRLQSLRALVTGWQSLRNLMQLCDVVEQRRQYLALLRHAHRVRLLPLSSMSYFLESAPYQL